MNWEYKERLGIHERMKEVVQLTLDATKKQLEYERRKLRKLRYGR